MRVSGPKSMLLYHRLSRQKLEGTSEILSQRLYSNIEQFRYDLRDTVQELRKTNGRLNTLLEQNQRYPN